MKEKDDTIIRQEGIITRFQDEEDTAPLHSRQRRKREAQIHNTSRAIGENILPIGDDSENGGMLFMYTASQDENIFNVYNTNSMEKDPENLLKLPSNYVVWYQPSAIAKSLQIYYEEEKLNKLILENMKRLWPDDNPEESVVSNVPSVCESSTN